MSYACDRAMCRLLIGTHVDKCESAHRRLELAVERAAMEIKVDIRTGRVPATIASFSELHDYVDANGYGGAFETEFGPDDCEFWNRMQDRIDRWLKNGRKGAA